MCCTPREHIASYSVPNGAVGPKPLRDRAYDVICKIITRESGPFGGLARRQTCLRGRLPPIERHAKLLAGVDRRSMLPARFRPRGPCMQFGIAADHAGFALKEHLVARARQSGHEVVDFGAQAYQPDDDYPDRVIPLAQAVAAGRVARGIAVCGSGIGACIASNKIAGVRAAVCHDTYSARQGVEHDDMNVLVLGARVVGTELAWELVRAFLEATFTAEQRHVRRLQTIAALENGG